MSTLPTAPLRRGFLMLAIAVTAFLQINTPARGQLPGGGKPLVAVWCESFAEAELLVAQMVVAMPSAPPGCHVVNPVIFPNAEMMTKATLVIGPLVDFDQDTFGVFQVQGRNGVFFPFIWWAPGFSPIGMGV